MKMLSLRSPRRAFTLMELMFAVSIGIMVMGGIMLLLVQVGVEQRNGLASATVELNGYVLESQITSCLRSKSGTQGFTPDYATAVTDGGGNPLGYKSIFVFSPTTNGYVMGRIQFDSASGVVRFIPDVSSPNTQSLWATNSINSRLNALYFSNSYNLDGSLNASLVRVSFDLDDNGISMRSTNNNPTRAFRSFAVQLRSD